MRSTATQARGMLTILRAWPGQRRIPYLPRHRIEALRDARIRSTVAFAAAHVPHYREAFRRDGIDPREIRGAADLERLPLVDKQAVQEDPQRFRPELPEAERSVPFKTTGSTGMPLTVHHDRESLLVNVAYGERERAPIVKLCGKRLRYVTLNIAHARTTGKLVRGFYAQSSFRPLRPRVVNADLAEGQARMVAELNRVRPDVVTLDGSYLEVLVRWAVAEGVELWSPKVFVYRGDAMSPDGPEFVERHTGAAVLSRYNAVEAFKIGFTCEHRGGFHLHEDLCHVAVVGADGQRVRPGDAGEVVISNLVNRGTVLLNYRLGDTARVAEGTCPCRRTTKLLAGLEGRVSEVVKLADGRLIHPLTVWSKLRKHDEIVRYQLVQRERERFELRVVLGQGASDPALTEAAASELREVLGGATVDVVRLDRLEAGPRGKFLPVVALAEDA